MGMTIDNCVETLTSILAEATANEDAVCYVTLADVPSLKMAISTMHKYQKIEQMLYEFKDMIHAPCLMKGHICAVHEILNEVVEDADTN